MSFSVVIIRNAFCVNENVFVTQIFLCNAIKAKEELLYLTVKVYDVFML